MFGRTKLLILTTLIIFISASISVIGLPWNYDMWKQKSIKPYEMPMSYPKGTVTIDGIVNPEKREKVEAITQNGLEASKLDVKIGEQLYMTNCSVCHGEKADGNGPVIKKGFYPVNLKVQAVKDRTDGYIFAYIRYGGKVMMPSYRENMTEEQSWQVVNYIRHIQNSSK
ncbi:MAG TPA: cytochrome c [Thermodesulfobacteriota bacterium]|nr:cytochrome c [Thermodesulfobacteriota bacterium]